MNNILNELCDLRRADAVEREKTTPYEEVMRRIENMAAPRDFAAAFRGNGINIIAELKKASPSEGMIREDFRPAELAEELAGAGAAAMSVLCEPHRFLGGEEYLRTARQVVDIPILYKDFISTRYQVAEARAAGADCILLIAAALDDAALVALRAQARELGMAALVETHSESEIRRAIALDCKIIGVNCRDLRNFRTDTSLIAELIGLIPKECTRIAESGMRTAKAIREAHEAGADGFLVGTALMRSPRPGMKLRELMTEEN